MHPTEGVASKIKIRQKDGLRATKNALEDEALVPGAGAFELAASLHLLDLNIATCSRQGRDSETLGTKNQHQGFTIHQALAHISFQLTNT